MKKIFLTILIGSLLLFWANANSNAEVNFGVKSLTFHNSIIPLDHSLGSYFGASLGRNAVLLGGVDYGRLGLSIELPSGELISAKQEMSFSYLMLHGGLKFYLKPREEGKVSPYLLGEVVKSFGSVDLGELGESLDTLGVSGKTLEDAIGDFLSPFGIIGGFGSEYYFSDNFGIGGEVGLRLLFTSTEPSLGDTKIKISLNQYFIYSGFTLNFSL
jgi:hypothetical protein